MDLYEKEVSELLNLFRRISKLKDKKLGREFFIQATHPPSYKKIDFDSLRTELISGIGRQISITDIIIKRNQSRKTQISRVVELSYLEMAGFLSNFVKSMDSEKFRNEEFQISDENKYWDLRKKAGRFAGSLRLRKKMGTLKEFKVPSDLKQDLGVFLEQEYNPTTVERLCQKMKGLLLKQLRELESIIPPERIYERMSEDGIEQMRDVPGNEKQFLEENENTCNALLRCIHSEEVIASEFKKFILKFFNKTMIIDRMVGREEIKEQKLE